MNGRRVHLLLVEDNPADVTLTRKALRLGEVIDSIDVVGDGVEALSLLRREAPYEQALRPDLVLLDLNLPRMDGRELLEVIRADAALRSIPVVVLTSSEDEVDIQRCYQSGANCYVSKPVDLHAFLAAVRAIETFWVATARLPGG